MKYYSPTEIPVGEGSACRRERFVVCMNVSDFYYDLPERLIAQSPAEHRDESRLLVIDKKTGDLAHRHFYDIEEYLNPGDVLVLNDSRVIPARIYTKRKDTGADVEVFLIKPLPGNCWECMVRPGKKAKKGKELVVEDVSLRVEEELENGNRKISFACEGDLSEKLKQIGQIPLPPYIHEKLKDGERYQTVYSKAEGSVAAPTAGLHFTPELLEKLKTKGVQLCFVTLHVGIGTFRPVKSETVEGHKMHSEYYIFPQSAADMINSGRKNGGKIVAVGTTACRVLETVGNKFDGELSESCGETDIFIYPGYRFKVVDRLITNFHLPESTLVMLVSALSSREIVMNAYREAVEREYRFFSLGDACFFK